MKLKPKEVFFVLLPIILAALFSYYLQGLILTNKEQFTQWLSSFGSYVILVYFVLQAVTVIIAPLGGFFLFIAMVALYGPMVAIVLAYLITAPCYVLNFYLARKYGRPLVRKMIGESSMERIDHFIKDAGTSTLVILRLLQGGSFDYLSYGLGLTVIPFKTFIWVNFLVGIPSSVLTYLILSSIESLAAGVVVFYAITGVLAGLSIYINHQIIKHRRI